ncbi:hypothetical protein FOZ63_015457, partial [Perkinsus olseni]
LLQEKKIDSPSSLLNDVAAKTLTAARRIQFGALLLLYSLDQHSAPGNVTGSPHRVVTNNDSRRSLHLSMIRQSVTGGIQMPASAMARSTFILSAFIFLCSCAASNPFNGYTLPGDDQDWLAWGPPGNTTVAPDLSSAAEALSIEERLQDLEILPYRSLTTAVPSSLNPTTAAVTSKSVLEQLAKLEIPRGDILLATAMNTTASPQGNLRGGGLTSFGGTKSVAWVVLGVVATTVM